MTSIKIEEGKLEKKRKLLDAGYTLFTEKGFKNTSIQEIVDKAKVAKGTFYLYFNDKYELQDHLIAVKSHQLFNDALNKLNETKIKEFDKQIIFIIDYVIDQLASKPILLNLIGKNISLGVYSKTLTKVLADDSLGLYNLFLNGIKENKIKMNNPEVILYMIIELVSSTCYTSITKNEPLPINAYKPYLYKTISNIIKNGN